MKRGINLRRPKDRPRSSTPRRLAEIGPLPPNDKRPRRAVSWANGWLKGGLLCTQSDQRFGGVANFEAAALAFFFGPVLAFFLSLP